VDDYWVSSVSSIRRKAEHGTHWICGSKQAVDERVSGAGDNICTKFELDQCLMPHRFEITYTNEQQDHILPIATGDEVIQMVVLKGVADIQVLSIQGPPLCNYETGTSRSRQQ
jgi:hypothetical protein